MAGTIPLSLTQQLDEYGQPLSGGQLWIIQAGTTSTPQNPYQDTGLSILLPNPITLDAAGRIPQFFLADGQIKVRLQDKFGVVKFVQDNILVIGPSAGGGGGGGSVDPTTVMQTGDMKFRHDIAIIAGFVRLNGKTIGSASSGATELADPSAQALFLYLWGKDNTLVVTPGGHGVSAAADWAANKQIAVPDWRGYAIAGLDDMGNAPAGRLTATYWGGSPTTLGSVGGGESYVITNAQMPSHYHAANMYDPTHAHSLSGGVWGGTAGNSLNYYQGGGQGSPMQAIIVNAASTGVRINAGNGLDLTGSQGGGQAHRTIGPTKLVTFYMKL